MIPNLIHAIPIVIEPILRAQTVVDDDYREEYETVARGAQVTVPGMLRWLNDKKYEPSKIGAEQHSDGYVTFRTLDLKNAGITIKMGDRFVSFGEGTLLVPVNVFVNNVRYMGHYSDIGGPGLVRAFFHDRQPLKPPGAGL